MALRELRPERGRLGHPARPPERGRGRRRMTPLKRALVFASLAFVALMLALWIAVVSLEA